MINTFSLENIIVTLTITHYLIRFFYFTYTFRSKCKNKLTYNIFMFSSSF